MNLKEPTFAQGMIAGHGVGMELARREIRRAIAGPLWELRGSTHGVCDARKGCWMCDAIRAIDRATRVTRKPRAK